MIKTAMTVKTDPKIGIKTRPTATHWRNAILNVKTMIRHPQPKNSNALSLYRLIRILEVFLGSRTKTFSEGKLLMALATSFLSTDPLNEIMENHKFFWW